MGAYFKGRKGRGKGGEGATSNEDGRKGRQERGRGKGAEGNSPLTSPQSQCG